MKHKRRFRGILRLRRFAFALFITALALAALGLLTPSGTPLTAAQNDYGADGGYDGSVVAAAVNGTKFDDANANGVRDVSEVGIPGVTIEVSDVDENLVATTTTDADGGYAFSELPAGTVIVSEVVPDGWTQTYPPSGTYTVELAADQVLGGLDFGNTSAPVPAPSAPCAPPPDDMVAWWGLDETSGTTAVEMVNENDGTHVGGPTIVAGMVDQALFFDGVDDYVEVANGDDLNFDEGNFSIDAWIRTESTHNYQVIVDKQGAAPMGYQFLLYHGRLMFELAASNGWSSYYNPSSPLLNDGEWHFVAVTVDRNGESQLYVDGTVIHTFNPSRRIGSISNNLNLRIGKHEANQAFPNDAWFEGQIDEVEFFKRALTPAEITDIFDAGSSGKCKSAIHGIKFNDLNKDGIKDPDEPGLSGWVITLTDSQGNVFTTTTDADGNYWFEPLPIGAYTVAEVQQEGWTQTLPLSESYNVELEVGQVVEDIDFGNMSTSCLLAPNNMVAWWPLDEDGSVAADIVGGHDGTHVNGPTRIGGMVDYALRFDGVDDSVEVPDAPNLNFGTGDFSIDAWIRTDSQESYQVLLDKRDFARIGYKLFLYNGLLIFELADNNGWSTYYNPASQALNDGNWHLVAVTIDRDDITGGKLIVDGEVIHTFNPTKRAGSIDNSADLWIGKHHINKALGTELWFEGDIDEIELFDRALTVSEIQEIFDIGHAGKCKGGIGGMKFHDLNGDGVKDPDEPGLADWEITLTGVDGITLVMTTDADGKYEFLPLAAGTYMVSEVQQDDWTQTFPAAPGTHSVVLGGNQYVSNIDFGNQLSSHSVCVGSHDPDYDSFTGSVAVATTFVDMINDTHVLSVVGLKEQATAPIYPSDWKPSIYHHEDWTRDDTDGDDLYLGNIFGLTLDNNDNIYVAATSVYPTDIFGPSGSGAVYKIDGQTGSISTFATLPNQSASASQSPGLGNITYDPTHEHFLVTNHEDGLIYRLDSSGNTLNTYDHGMNPNNPNPISDDGTSGFTQLGRRLWGLEVHNNRLYYSVWWEDGGRPNANQSNEIWSVALNDAGNFDPNTAQREIELPPYSRNYSNPVSDISFSPVGCMLLAERSMLSDSGSSAHSARVLEYVMSGSNWIPSSNTFSIGGGGRDSAGGVDYDYAPNGRVWATGDALRLDSVRVYGLQGLPATGGTVHDSIMVDLNGQTAFFDKREIGDVEISTPPPVALGHIDGTAFYDLNGDGLQDSNESGLPDVEIILLDAEGATLSTTTDGNGHYQFTPLAAGTYTVSQALQDGWVQTYPLSGTHRIVLEAGQAVENIDFGNLESSN